MCVDNLVLERQELISSEKPVFPQDIVYGSKVLHLYRDGENTFRSYVENNNDADRLPQETTEVYSLAKAEMEKAAAFTHTPQIYIFETKIEQMLAWARTKGNDLFQWESERFDEVNKMHVFKTKIGI